MFDFLNPLTEADFNQETEFLMDGFVAKNLITLFYADGGEGKTFLALGIAKYLDKQGLSVVYIDYDNGLKSLKDRGVDKKLIKTCQHLKYIGRSNAKIHAHEILLKIESMAVSGVFNNTVFILDSLRNFCDVNNDSATMKTMETLKNIREAGATVLILHHSNKDGRNYQGSNNIRNSLDNMYHVKKILTQKGQIRWVLTVKKERVAIEDTALSLKINDFDIHPINLAEARLTEEDRAFIQAVKASLVQTPNQNKTQLLKNCGYEKTDKTARDRLKQFSGVFWQEVQHRGIFSYRLK